MKILTPKHAELAFYSGKDGTYASVKPTDASAARLQAFCIVAKSMGFEKVTSPLDLHVTVMYSQVGLNHDYQLDLWSKYFSVEKVFSADVGDFTHWAGHDDEGYLVLELKSTALTELNGLLRDKYGLKSSFPDYKAHVTIATDAYVNGSPDKAEACCERLNSMRKPATLNFCGLRVEDLKG